MKMAVIQQEIQDLKGQLDSDGRQRHFSKDQKIVKKIENLKEHFRELLVECRQRKAAESENAMILTEDDNVSINLLLRGQLTHAFRVRDFPAVLKTHWWTRLFSALWWCCCLFDTFPISILNFIPVCNYICVILPQ